MRGALADVSILLARLGLALALLCAALVAGRALLGRLSRGVAVPLAVRIAGTVLGAAWLLTVSFFVLAGLRLFNRAAVAVLAAACLVGGTAIARRLVWEVRVVSRWTRSRRRRPALVAAAAVLLLLSLRALILPPIAWDTLTYHLVKAGIWAQSGSADLFSAPGGWSFYRAFVGGGEVLWAWAMLPLGADTLVGVADVGAWVLLGCATALVGRELGLRPRESWLAAGFVLATPAALLAVGTAYVDNAGHAFSTLAVAFTLRFLRRGEPAWIAAAAAGFGLAAGVKLTALPLVALPALAVAFGLLHFPRRRGRLVGMAALALGLWAAVALPWIARNLGESGHPFGPYPMRLAGWTLGADPEFSWYLQQNVGGRTFADEWRALVTLISTPLGNSLGGFPAVPLLLAPAGVWALARRAPSRAAVALLVFLAAAAVYMAPQFAVTRLGWPQVNGRYFLLPVALATCLGFVAAGRHARAYSAFLALAVAFNLWVYGSLHWSPLEVRLLQEHGLLLAALVALAARVSRPGTGRRVATAAALACAFVVYAALCRATERYRLMADGVSGHSVDKYWLSAARAADNPREPYRIAVTSGPWQMADNWFLYPFLGSRLQNVLEYVPPTRSGEIVPLAAQRPAAEGDREAWLERLQRRGVHAVMSFAPPGPELSWMEADRPRFVRMAGDGATWGLYALVPDSR